jgi:hypothetical protein
MNKSSLTCVQGLLLLISYDGQYRIAFSDGVVAYSRFRSPKWVSVVPETAKKHQPFIKLKVELDALLSMFDLR